MYLSSGEKFGIFFAGSLLLINTLVCCQGGDEKKRPQTTKEKMNSCVMLCGDAAVKSWEVNKRCECE